MKTLLAFLVLPSLCGAVTVDLPADGDPIQIIRAAIPHSDRFTPPGETRLQAGGRLTLRLPPLDPLSRGHYVRTLRQRLSESQTLDVSRASIEVLDAAGEGVRWEDPVTQSHRVVVPWPISLFYADKLGRTLRRELPAAAARDDHPQRPLCLLGEIIFDLSGVPEARRDAIEAQIKEVLRHPKQPGVKDPVDVSDAIVRFTRSGGGTSFNIGALVPLDPRYSKYDYDGFDIPDLPTNVERAPRPTTLVPVPTRPFATADELAHQTLVTIAELLVAGRRAPSRVIVSDMTVDPRQRLEFRRALIERWNRGVFLDGVAVDLSGVEIELVQLVDHCGSRLAEK